MCHAGISTPRVALQDFLGTVSPIGVSTYTIKVPDASAGLLIGKGGATIALIEAYSGCKLGIQRRREGKVVEIAYPTSDALTAAQGAVACFTQLNKEDKQHVELMKLMTSVFGAGKRRVDVKLESADDGVGEPELADARADRLEDATTPPPTTPDQHSVQRRGHGWDPDGLQVNNPYLAPRKMKRDERELSPAIHNCTHAVPGEHGLRLATSSARKRAEREGIRPAFAQPQ